MPLPEQLARKRINNQLARAGWGWDSMAVANEFVLHNSSVLREDTENPYEVADYVIFDATGVPLAVVEAKKATRHPLEAERQAADYADLILKSYGVEPFIFLANGDEIWFWHRKFYTPRKVSGFFTEKDLLRLRHLATYGKPLTGCAPVAQIIDRAYQIEAVKTIAENVEKGHRRFLMELATGTGKTRVAVALVELLQRQGRIQRVLFLADRRELVKQALGAFKEHLPSAPRSWIEGGVIDAGAQIHFATYPGMMGLYQQMSPGYYDMVIADESHRSIYSRYRAILDHFDALQLGLTATPTDFIGHDTFQLFGCPTDDPTFRYGYEEAVRDKHLVPYRPVHEARTHFQIEGLKPGELPAEVRQQVTDQGLDADDFSFEGSDLERSVSNTGTHDAIVREFMDHAIRDSTGTLPAKAIIFAISHRHALDLYKSFNRLYPDLQRRGLAKVIDSQMERAEKTLDDFKNKEFPRVAISVDMLDTGIDVPAIRTLVFAKPVFSKVKFWQMLGRGTRTWTDPSTGEKKADFLVIDHWEVFESFKVNKDGRSPAVSEPLPSRLFRLRLEKYQILAGRDDVAGATAAMLQLKDMLRHLPLENISVAPHADFIREWTESENPRPSLTEASTAHLCHVLAPLLRFAQVGPYDELQFENLTEQAALAALRADAADLENIGGKISESLSLLPANLPEIRPHLATLDAVQAADFWPTVACGDLMRLQATFAPLMRFKNRRPSGIFVQLQLPDKITQRRWITFGPAEEKAEADAYRARIETLVKDLANDHPALQKLQRGEPLSDAEIESLSSVLHGPDLFVTESLLREAYDNRSASLADFLRHILAVASLPSREDAISQAFDAWVREHPQFSATQLMFIRTLRKAIMQKAEVRTVESLREPPFTAIGDPENLFKPRDLADLMDLVHALAA